MWNDGSDLGCIHSGLGETFLEQRHLSQDLGDNKVPTTWAWRDKRTSGGGDSRGRDSDTGPPLEWLRHKRRSADAPVNRRGAVKEVSRARWGAALWKTAEFRLYTKLVECHQRVFRGFLPPVSWYFEKYYTLVLVCSWIWVVDKSRGFHISSDERW